MVRKNRFESKLNRQQEAIVQALNDVNPEIRELMNAYAEVNKRQRITKRFKVILSSTASNNLVSETFQQDLLMSVRQKYPELSTAGQKFLKTNNLVLLKYPRRIYAEQKCVDEAISQTLLSMYTFSQKDTERTDAHVQCYDIRNMYVTLSRLLRESGHKRGMRRVPKSIELTNPFGKHPRILRQWDLFRVYTWYKTYRLYYRHRSQLSQKDRDYLEQFDMFLYPSAVQYQDYSISGKMWHGIKRWVTPVYQNKYVRLLLRNQFIMGFIQQMVCILGVLFLSHVFGFSVDMQKFLVSLLLGFFVYSVLLHIKRQISILQGEFDRWDTSILGPHISPIINNIFNWAERVANLAQGNVAIAMIGIDKLIQKVLTYITTDKLYLLFKALSLPFVTSSWLEIASAMFKFFISTVRKEGLTLSRFFAVYGLPYLCNMIVENVPSAVKIISYKTRIKPCQKLVKVIQHVINTTSFGVTLWNIMTDLHLFAKLYQQKSLQVQDLKKFQSDSACINSLVYATTLKLEQNYTKPNLDQGIYEEKYDMLRKDAFTNTPKQKAAETISLQNMGFKQQQNEIPMNWVDWAANFFSSNTNLEQYNQEVGKTQQDAT